MKTEIQTKQNNGLTARQQKLSTQIAKVGELNEVGFAKQVLEFRKISELERQEISEGLGFIFVKVANLAGIKEQISPNNKQDISEMIRVKFKRLSLEEIDYAFKLDRWSGDPVEHFQLFNSEYVGKVLTKYVHLLRNKRNIHQLPIAKKKEQKNNWSEEEKQIIIYNGLVDCFENYIACGEIDEGRLWVYDHLYKRGLLPEHNENFRKKIKTKAVKEIYKQKELQSTNREINKVLEKIRHGETKLSRQCKILVIKEYFNRINAQGKTIEAELKKTR